MKFSDGFGGSTLNTSKWSPGWFGTGNTGPVNSEEKAGYSPNAITLSGGDAHLSLTHKTITTPKGTFPYTGAILSAAGKFDYAFGAIEFDAFLPANGSHVANWPAFWSDGNGTWPTTGENDTMEGLDGDACWHFHSPAGGPGDCAPGNFSGWHRFGSDWENGVVRYYYDGKLVGKITTGITSARMFPIIDYTTNGSNVIAPATMEVNWVRVWQ